MAFFFQKSISWDFFHQKNMSKAFLSIKKVFYGVSFYQQKRVMNLHFCFDTSPKNWKVRTHLKIYFVRKSKVEWAKGSIVHGIVELLKGCHKHPLVGDWSTSNENTAQYTLLLVSSFLCATIKYMNFSNYDSQKYL